MKVLLWETRTSKGFTLMELAKKSGIGKSTLNNIENGKVSPDIVSTRNDSDCTGGQNHRPV